MSDGPKQRDLTFSRDHRGERPPSRTASPREGDEVLEESRGLDVVAALTKSRRGRRMPRIYRYGLSAFSPVASSPGVDLGGALALT